MPQKEVEFERVGETFEFACHPDVPCFKACCRKLDLVLTPYDIFRLKKTLGLDAADFLDQHTEKIADRPGRWPLLKLKMSDNEERTCPFLGEDGCTVYADRPGACRIYPLGRGTRPGGPSGVIEKYMVVREKHCRGFEEPKTWTVEEWLSDQDLATYHSHNDQWMKVITHPKGPGEGEAEAKNLGMFSLASYNLDRFSDFVLKTKFLSLFEVDQARLARIEADQAELLFLAYDWLLFSILGERTMEMK